MIISFAKTTGALLAGEKTVTRRDWSDKHAAKFKAGMLVDAWNYGPRVVSKNPHKIATIRLTDSPTLESSSAFAFASAPEWFAEGFDWLTANGFGAEVQAIVDDWCRNKRDLYVVRFEVVGVFV